MGESRMSAVDRLAQAIYGRNAEVRELMGGCEAKILDDAAWQIRTLRRLLENCVLEEGDDGVYREKNGD